MKPVIGRVVHYVSHGTPGGEYGKECRAATITAVNVTNDEMTVSLCVLNPTGMFFNTQVHHEPFGSPTDDDFKHQHCSGRHNRGGTWHWPSTSTFIKR